MKLNDGILVLSDEEASAEALSSCLCESGIQVQECGSCRDAAAHIGRNGPELVVLDLTTPSVVAGITLCRDIRARYCGPLIVLSAVQDELSQILSLEMGADDYLSKPVSFSLLVARVKALLRRISPLAAPLLSVGDLTIDFRRREVRRGERPVAMTTREFDLLWMLASNAGKVLCREEIHRKVFQSEYNGYDRSVDIYMSRIRKKLGGDPPDHNLIKTIRGSGYLFISE